MKIQLRRDAFAAGTESEVSMWNRPGTALKVTRGGVVYQYWARNTKLATGMSKTAASQKRRQFSEDEHDKDVVSLLVRGTTAKGTGLMFYMGWTATQCPCCEQPIKKRALNDAGRRRLARLKARKQ